MIWKNPIFRIVRILIKYRSRIDLKRSFRDSLMLLFMMSLTEKREIDVHFM